MEKHDLWNQLQNWKEKHTWVDLTHSLSPSTPHWEGWEAMQIEEKANLNSSLFSAHAYTTVGQYGTHVDAPSHMVKGGRSLDAITLQEMAMPLCVINKVSAVEKNVDYSVTRSDIEEWEKENGKIPAGGFVVFRSDWSKRDPATMDNCDGEGNRHFPGWSLEAVKFMVEDRNIGGIGHETSDTEAPVCSCKSNYEVEYYILEQDRIQLELLANIDKCPVTGAIIFCTFPKVENGSGFPARCFAICP